MRSSEDKIIITYLIISGAFNFSASLIWGINTLFLLKAGMSFFQVFVVNAVYSASMCLFEIPTGIFADTLGRRMSFLSSSFVLMLGTIGYVGAASFNNNFWLFCLMSVILGLAYTFYSGAVEAWLVDALNFAGYQKEIDHVFARGGIVTNIGVFLGAILGGVLGTVNLSLPYLVRAFIQLLVFLFAIVAMHDLGYAKSHLALKNIPAQMKKIGIESINYGFHNRSVRLLMLVSFVFSSFMMWGWYAWQPYFLQLYGDPKAVWIAGVVSALFSLAQVGGSIVVAVLLARLKKRTSLLLLTYGVQAIAIIGIGLAPSFFSAAGFLLCFSFFLGMAMPVKQAYLHNLIPSEHRATIISFDSLVGSGGSVFGQLGYGYLAQRLSIGSGYVCSGMVNLLIIPILYLLRSRKGIEDLL